MQKAFGNEVRLPGGKSAGTFIQGAAGLRGVAPNGDGPELRYVSMKAGEIAREEAPPGGGAATPSNPQFCPLGLAVHAWRLLVRGRESCTSNP